MIQVFMNEEIRNRNGEQRYENNLDKSITILINMQINKNNDCYSIRNAYFYGQI